MEIKTLGGCCKRSTQKYESINEAVRELGLDVEVIHVTDMNELLSLGIMLTPGLVIDGRVLFSSRALNVEQVKEPTRRMMNKENQ